MPDRLVCHWMPAMYELDGKSLSIYNPYLFITNMYRFYIK